MNAGTVAKAAGFGVMCILSALVLAASGFSSYLVSSVKSIGGSHAIRSGPSVGAQNILLMGLESRTDWAGNELPRRILRKLHSGTTGGNATNTLILIHVFAGGKRAVGLSIPRDDLVNFVHTVGPQQRGKIDQAYGVSMYYKEGLLRQKHPNMSQNRLAFLGNEAGQAAAVATVEKLTGVRVDHFAVTNLFGFYELAKVFGGVEVCLNHAVRDRYSGANFHKGYQHLDASQALSFVRQRHGLPNGDLDRTHRQQAFIDSIIHQVRTEGLLSDLTKLSALISVAKRYVITDAGWNLLKFAGELRALTAGHIVFRTLPIQHYATWGNPVQDVNIVNTARIKAIVRAEFRAPPGSHHASKQQDKAKHQRPVQRATVDVFNGTQTPLLAAHVSAALKRAGYPTGTPANTSPQGATSVKYGPGASASGVAIAKLFGVKAVASQAVKASHVEVLLGTGATVPHVRPSGSPSPSRSLIPNTGPQGGAVRVGKRGIPCVN